MGIYFSAEVEGMSLLPLVINSVKPGTRPRRKDVVAGWRVCLHQPSDPHTHPSLQPSILRKPQPFASPWALSLALLVRRYPFLIRFTQHFLPACFVFHCLFAGDLSLSLQLCCVYYARFARNWTASDPGLKHQSTVRLIMWKVQKTLDFIG